MLAAAFIDSAAVVPTVTYLQEKKLVDIDDLGDGEGEDDKDGYEMRMQELDGKNGIGDGEKGATGCPKKTTFLKGAGSFHIHCKTMNELGSEVGIVALVAFV